MTVYGFHSGKKNASRRKQIRAYCKKNALGTPTFTSTDYMKSIALMHRSNEQCILVGAVDDIQPPAPHQSSPVYEWREVFFHYIEENGISFHPIDLDTYALSDSESRTSMSAIRSFRRACKAFKHHVRKVDRQDLGAPYAFGRPPYGYNIVGGKLTTEPEQALAISAIFKKHEAGDTIPQIVAFLRQEHGNMPELNKKLGKKQHELHPWAYKKVARILSKSSLYCEGLYTGGNMTLQIPDIIIHNPHPAKRGSKETP